MTNDQDSGLVKRGFMLLGAMLLIGATVLFIVFQGPRGGGSVAPQKVEEHAPSAVGWEIRQNAAATLARRASDKVSWSVFREMVDLPTMTANCREQFHDDKESPETSARDMVVIALKALAVWHEKRREAGKTDVFEGLPAVYAAVDRLSESSDPILREQAEKTRETFFR